MQFLTSKYIGAAVLCTAFLAGCGDSASTTDEEQGALSNAADVTLAYGIKTFEFTWTDIAGASFYRVLENPDGLSGYSQVGEDIPTGVEAYNYAAALHKLVNASYLLQTCDDTSCVDSDEIFITDNLVDAIGYIKASNAEANDRFGESVAVSGDGTVIAIGSYDDSSTDGVFTDSSGSDNNASQAGAVYIFRLIDNTWTETAYLKASNSGTGDNFGNNVALSDDGTVLAVSARAERSSITGVFTDTSSENDDTDRAGAVYIFNHTDNGWSEDFFIKAPNSVVFDAFGDSMTLSGDGKTLAVGVPRKDVNANSDGTVYVYKFANATWEAPTQLLASNNGEGDLFGSGLALNDDGTRIAVSATSEDNSITGVTNAAASTATDDDSASGSGAVYIFDFENDAWSETAYIKASNSGAGDQFGISVALNDAGSTLAVGASREDSSTTGTASSTANSDDLSDGTGAVYIFENDSNAWSETAYIKASNAGENDNFGNIVAFNGDGTLLAVSASNEGGSSKGVSATTNEANDDSELSGAVYTFEYANSAWTQMAYIKASNTHSVTQIDDHDEVLGDLFGSELSVSDDGNVLLVGTTLEDGSSTGISAGAVNDNDDASGSGAVYLY